MASLAPGNGWFPHRAYDGRRAVYAVRKQIGGDNVYPFPQARAATRAKVRHGALAQLVAAIVLNSTRSGRSAVWVLAWCLFGVALATMAWVALVGALFAAAIAIGISWTTATVTLGAAHLLAAALAGLVGVRVGRSLIAPPQHPRLPRKSA